MPRVIGVIGSLVRFALSVAAAESRILFRGQEETEVAPHGKGNVYAPRVPRDGGRYRMWYGGQGRDGHDRKGHVRPHLF